eukprot:1775986-Heterocapsa_arctica.AAC.1
MRLVYNNTTLDPLVDVGHYGIRVWSSIDALLRLRGGMRNDDDDDDDDHHHHDNDDTNNDNDGHAVVEEVMRQLREGLETLPQVVRDNVHRIFNETIADDAVNIDDPAYPGVFRAAIQRALAMLDDFHDEVVNHHHDNDNDTDTDHDNHHHDDGDHPDFDPYDPGY